MGNRVHKQPAAPVSEGLPLLTIPLSNLPAGKTGAVSCLEGDQDFVTHLACLGFTPGAVVTVLQNHGRGPIIVSLFNAHLALGRQEASLIQVHPE
jgi:ferrous iron transport protein A